MSLQMLPMHSLLTHTERHRQNTAISARRTEHLKREEARLSCERFALPSSFPSLHSDQCTVQHLYPCIRMGLSASGAAKAKGTKRRLPGGRFRS